MKFSVIRGFAAAGVCAGALTISAAASADVTYDTTYAWNGSSSIQPFGNPNTSTYGQTFIAPVAASVLDDFTFYINGGANLQFQAQVYAWSGSMVGGGGGGATGPALFTSDAIVFGPTAGFVPVMIDTGDLVLAGGGQYVALFTISGPNETDYPNSTGTDVWGDLLFTHAPGNGGGGFVFYNNGSNSSALNTSAWDNFGDFGDSAWTAHFDPLPEPLTLGLFGAGLAGLGAIRRRKLA